MHTTWAGHALSSLMIIVTMVGGGYWYINDQHAEFEKRDRMIAAVQVEVAKVDAHQEEMQRQLDSAERSQQQYESTMASRLLEMAVTLGQATTSLADLKQEHHR